MDFKKDYYQILEVQKTASKEEIRASYRKLAKLYHPDKNPGNADAEEKFKSINEAHEILSNDILRHEYDAYRLEKEKWDAKQKANSAANNASSNTNRKTYTRKKTIKKEIRIYIKGVIIVKYCADPEDEISSSFKTEFKFKINPVEAKVEIRETDIHIHQDIPLHYLKAFKESDLFKCPLPQPAKCTIRTDTGQGFYELDLYDIRIKNIQIEGVTKHEKRSFGTLKGELYAYTPKYEECEEIIEVTECFGESGKIETKVEGESSFFHKEYYNADCTTYWGPWLVEKSYSPKQSKAKKEQVLYEASSGCLGWFWLPVLALFIFLFPKFFLALLILAVIVTLFSFAISILNFLGRAIPIVAVISLLIFMISTIRSTSGKGISYVNHDTASLQALKTTREPVLRTDPKDQNNTFPDTLISHSISWKDYENNPYQITLSISTSNLRSSIANHNNMEPLFTNNSLAPAYASLLQEDKNKLNLIYGALDSIKASKSLNDLTFARMLVSCIQSIPYFLVVDQSCSDNYADEYTRNYLASCTRECCVGFEKYGVRSPIEFLSDLKGDCDTRSLLLYNIFKRYNYNVALITSQYYKHAMIAVSFGDDKINNGLSMNINNRNYYLWETTNSGFDVGQIPPNLQDLDYWETALLNENH